MRIADPQGRGLLVRARSGRVLRLLILRCPVCKSSFVDTLGTGECPFYGDVRHTSWRFARRGRKEKAS